MTKAPDPHQRIVGGLLVALLGVLAALYLGYGARQSALDRAARQAGGVLASTLEHDQNSAGLQQQVAAWVVGSRADVSYLSVRAPNRRLLASAGAWSDWFEGWVAQSTARGWRAWAYRMFCAEGDRPLPTVNGSRLATLRIGIAWWAVLSGAGISFWLAMGMALLGGGLAWRERRGLEARSGRAQTAAEPAAGGSATKTMIGWKRLRERLKPRLAGRRRRNVPPARPNAGFQPIGRRSETPATEDTTASSTPASERGAAAVPAVDPSGPAPESAARPSVPDHAGPPPAEMARVLEPSFRFLPIWQGVADGLLAGAAVALARPGEHAESPWISVEELAASSRDEAKQRALTAWLIQRLATLQANWRTLELPQVPLFVAVPSTLLDFDRAVEIWADALDGFDQSAKDLVLCVERVPEPIRQVLPVRWAVAESDAGGRRRYRLVVWGEDQGNRSETAAGSRFEPIDMPGPDDHPAGEHARMPLPPREFARLLSHRELAPL